MIQDVRLKWLIAVVVLTILAGVVQATPVTIETVEVGDPGNVGENPYPAPAPPDICWGDVNHTYNIGKYEVTYGQYAEFLNAVAAADPNGLYNPNMDVDWEHVQGISRSGTPGSYHYYAGLSPSPWPVNYISWYDTLRFANWLHNGQPTGAQDASTTEDGAYDMSLSSSVVRKSGALYFLPSEDEWYKAAYYKGGGTDAGYWDFPTQSDTAPTAELPSGTDMVDGSANYNNVAMDSHTTMVGAYDAKPSDSAYGTFDQGGNLSEWNETLVDGSFRVLRGGSFEHSIMWGLRASDPESALPVAEDSHYGFRVASSAAVPESGSILVWLGLGAVGLIWWRRRR